MSGSFDGGWYTGGDEEGKSDPLRMLGMALLAIVAIVLIAYVAEYLVIDASGVRWGAPTKCPKCDCPKCPESGNGNGASNGETSEGAYVSPDMLMMADSEGMLTYAKEGACGRVKEGALTYADKEGMLTYAKEGALTYAKESMY